MLTAIEMVERMLIEELPEISFLTDHMFARGDENSIRAQHTKHFAARAIEMTGMMQNGSRKYNVECVISKWQAFGKLLDHIDRQPGCGGECPNCPGPNKGAGIRFERRHRKSFARKRIACNAPSST